MIALSGCAAASEGGGTVEDDRTPVPGGVLKYAQNSQPLGAGFDPIDGNSVFANKSYLSLVYDTLLTKDDDGVPQPGVAESWEWIDETRVEFTLRDDVAFSDGTPLTPEDVAFSIESNTKKYLVGPMAGYLGSTVTGEHTLEVAFETSNGAFVSLMADFAGVFIMNKEWYESTDSALRARDALGTGPFVLAGWDDNVKLTFEKNEHYWDAPKPYVDGLEVHVVPDDTARLSMVQQGIVDIAWFQDGGVAQQAEIAGYRTSASPVVRSMALYINAEDGPLSDENVRRAVSLSLNREEINDIAMEGRGEISLFTPPGEPLATAVDETTPNYTQDAAKAKKLLAESAFPKPTISLTYATDVSAGEVPALEMMKEQLAATGINLNLIGVPWAELSTVLTGAPAPRDLYLSPGFAQPDVTMYFGAINHRVLDKWGDDPTAAGAYAIYERLVQAVEPADRKKVIDELNDYVAEHVLAIVPLATPLFYEYWAPQVIGYSTDSYLSRSKLTEAWLDRKD